MLMAPHLIKHVSDNVVPFTVEFGRHIRLAHGSALQLSSVLYGHRNHCFDSLVRTSYETLDQIMSRGVNDLTGLLVKGGMSQTRALLIACRCFYRDQALDNSDMTQMQQCLNPPLRLKLVDLPQQQRGR